MTYDARIKFVCEVCILKCHLKDLFSRTRTRTLLCVS